MAEEHVEVFRRKLNENTLLTEEDLRGKIVIDVPMPLDYITRELTEELNLLEPFGKANEKPVFADKNIHILSMGVFGKNRNVCRMQVESQGGTRMNAVCFGQVEQLLNFLQEKFGRQALEQTLAGRDSGMRASFLYYPDLNVYNGQESLQIIVKNYC